MDGRLFRKKTGDPHPQLGIKPCRLPGSQLPTCGDVIGRVMMLRLEEMEEKSLDVNNVPVAKCMQKVTDEVLGIWEKASVPTRSRHHVLEMVRQLWEKKGNIRKSAKSKRAASGTAAAAAVVPELFDISSRVREPELEDDKAFLADQRGERRKHIGDVDRETTVRWDRRNERRARKEKTTSGTSDGAVVVTGKRSTTENFG